MFTGIRGRSGVITGGTATAEDVDAATLIELVGPFELDGSVLWLIFAMFEVAERGRRCVFRGRFTDSEEILFRFVGMETEAVFCDGGSEEAEEAGCVSSGGAVEGCDKTSD